MFINLHTHCQTQTGEIAVVNLCKNYGQVLDSGYYSVGIHPWYVNTPWLTQFKAIEEHGTYTNVVAIGETGLDKLCKTDWQIQLLIFKAHIQLASSLKKPLIIHCVKAWSEVRALLAKEKVSVPVIFHGYQKNKELAKQLTDEGYYLSFGKALEKDTAQEVLQAIPATRFFLETDDAPVTIESVYKNAATALSIDMNSLSLQLQQNAVAVFGPSFII